MKIIEAPYNPDVFFQYITFDISGLEKKFLGTLSKKPENFTVVAWKAILSQGREEALKFPVTTLKIHAKSLVSRFDET